MRIIIQEGETLTLAGCLARFGADFGIIGPGCELTHLIKRGRLYRLHGPAGSQREHLGFVERIEV